MIRGVDRQVRFILMVALALGVAACGSNTTDVPKPGTGGGPGIIPKPGTGGVGGGEGGAGGVGGEGGTGGTQATFRIDHVRPAKGPVSGGGRIVIQGKGFLQSVPDERSGASTKVSFGGNPAIDSRVVDDQTIFVTLPHGNMGYADVEVENSSGAVVCEGCFRYLGAVNLHGIEPANGPVEGGTEVTVRGEGLTDEMIVTFGGRAALQPKENEDGSLRVVLPPGAEPGPVDVRIFGDSGQAFLRRAFSYRETLQIDAIEPPGSPVSGGIQATIRGTGFTSATKIFFGDVEAEVAHTTDGLEVSVPPGMAPGLVGVEARDSAGSTTFPFAYFDPRSDEVALHMVAPNRGPSVGGNRVALVGSGFDALTMAVYFGSAASPEVVVENRNITRAVVPPGATGETDLRIRTGGEIVRLDSAYRYVQAITILGVEPSSGPTSGGTAIALTGAGFPEHPRVFVGGLQATKVVRVSDTRIEAETPVGADGAVGVRVVDDLDPINRGILQNAFVYEGPLGAALVDPPTGARAGGTIVTIRGKGFRGNMAVRFASVPSQSVTVLNPFTIEAIAPAGNTGPVDVEVERADGEKVTIPGGFTFFNPSSSYGGASGGPLSGTLNVTAIAADGPAAGSAIPNCPVYVGAENNAQLEKSTDSRGQVTFAAPSIVKAVTVTVFCEEYELATVVSQASENLTVLLSYNAPPPPPDGDPEDPPPDPPRPPPNTVGGSVFGFKKPPMRELGLDEEEVAFVSIAYPSIYGAPPFARQNGWAEVTEDGGSFAFSFYGPARFTFFAIYGIRNTTTGAFERILFGMDRGINLAVETDYYGVEIVLDTRLDVDVPVTILNPPRNLPGRVEAKAFLDLGDDGMIHLGSGFNNPNITQTVIRGLPNVSGESLIFQGAFTMQSATSPDGTVPFSFSFLRQGGNLANGIILGPMMGIADFVQPATAFFNGTFEWQPDPSPATPDLTYISVWAFPEEEDDPVIPQWQVVLPGDETRVTLPAPALQFLRSKYAGQVLGVTVISGSQPTFDFNQWNYLGIGLGSFTSFTYDAFGIIP